MSAGRLLDKSDYLLTLELRGESGMSVGDCLTKAITY